MRGYVGMLADSPLRPLFSRRLDADIDQGRIRRYLRHRQTLHAVEAVCRFGMWYDRYRERLSPLDLNEVAGADRASGRRGRDPSAAAESRGTL
jgi:hypothetical protein